VVERRVEVGVVGDRERQQRLDVRERVRVALGPRISGERRELLARRVPRGRARGHERVQRRRRERVRGAGEAVEQPVARQRRQIEHAVAAARARARAPARRAEHAVGEPGLRHGA
jgi:hypothetical protein